MAFTEKQEYKVEVIPPFKILQVCRVDIVLKDGKEVGRSKVRQSFGPGDDVSNEADDVKAVANALWTSEVVDAYKASIADPGSN
jgi:hypothetical protein